MVFFALCAAVTAINLWRGQSGSVAAPEFRSVRSNERVIPIGRAPARYMRIKLSYLERGTPYRVGYFADHTGSMFSRRAWPGNLGPSFFNYYMPTSSLPEIRDIIEYAGRRNLLPSDIIVVMLDNPLVGNGLLNYERRTNLFHEAFVSIDATSISNLPTSFERLYAVAENLVAQTLDWRSLWTSIFAPTQKTVILADRYCQANGVATDVAGKASPWIDYMPKRILSYLGLLVMSDDQKLAAIVCAEDMLPGFGVDGSERGRKKRIAVRFDERNLTRGRNKGGNLLEPRHADFIVENMEAIHRIVRTSGRTVIFMVPPVLGESPSMLPHKIFSAALAKLDKSIRLIDHRFKFQDIKYFHDDYEHTSVEYYAAVVEEFGRRGWLNRLK